MDCLLSIRAVPNASKAGIVGWHGEALKIKVQAPPEGGRANKELAATLAKALGLPKRAVSVARGETSRDKVLHIDGLSLEDVRSKLAQA